MSTEDAKPSDDKKAAEAAGGAAPKKPSAIGGVLKLVIPAIFAAGAAYGGTRLAAAKAPAADPHGGGHEAPVVRHAKPPGPTLPLEPFLVTVFDANKKPHPMKMTIAVEFDPATHDDLKTLTPRIRDVVLTYLRSMSHEQATDPVHVEKLRTELVEKCQKAGAVTAERILVTDFVVQ